MGKRLIMIQRCLPGLGLCAALAPTTCSTQQPQVQCIASFATFGAQYELVEGTGDCAMLKGEVLGVQSFVPDPSKSGDERISIGIKSDEVGYAIQAGELASPPVKDPDSSHSPVAIGKFSTLFPDQDNICTVPSMSTAELDRPEIPAGAQGERQEPVHIKYEWKNIRVFVTAGQTGLQFAAD